MPIAARARRAPEPSWRIWSGSGMSACRSKPQRPDLVATAVPPDYALGAHTLWSVMLRYGDAYRSKTGIIAHDQARLSRRARMSSWPTHAKSVRASGPSVNGTASSACFPPTKRGL